MANFLANIQKRRSDERLQDIDDELKAVEDQQKRLQELADAGSEQAVETLAFEQKQTAELRAEKEQELQRQKQIEAGLAAFQTFSGLIQQGESVESAPRRGSCCRLLH